MIYEEGDIVEIISGEGEGQEAEVIYYFNEGSFYIVQVDDVNLEKTSGELIPIVDIYEYEDEEEEPEIPAFGLSSEQLSQYTEKFLQGCLSRITGVGNAQYSHEGYQKFENMTPLELLDAVQEEIKDIPNYCAFLYIMTQRMRYAIEEASLG